MPHYTQSHISHISKGGGVESFNENSRVKIPALLTLARLGFSYLSLKGNTQSQFDKTSNIFLPSFFKSLQSLNPTLLESNLPSILSSIQNILFYDDLGLAFYESLTKGLSNHNTESQNTLKLIDWQNPSNNTFEMVTELPYGRDSKGSFRPDITLFINGLPLAFIEVKKPNNEQGIQAEIERAKDRFNNKSFKPYFNLTQIIVYSNNLEYDESELMPLSGAFYSTSYSLKINHFREERAETDQLFNLKELDSSIRDEILRDTNAQAIAQSSEFHTNTELNTPTNRLLVSLFSHKRLLFLLYYGIAFIRDKDIQRHILRYPQFLAMQAIKDKLSIWERSDDTKSQSLPLKRGIIWHTQGSGKTALSYYLTRFLRNFYQHKNIITRFYFVTDRIDLCAQAKSEFTKRELYVKEISSKQDFIDELTSSSIHNNEGKDEIICVNIQKFSEDAVSVPNLYNITIQRVFFIDEAHRSYNEKGSFLAYLFSADKNALFLSLTGTPLLATGNKVSSKEIFGEYFHIYYYNASIKDGYTLRLIKEDIQTSYKENLSNAIKNLEIPKGLIQSSDIYTHKSFIAPLLDYIVNDFSTSRKVLDESIGAMVVCQSAKQAKALYQSSLETSNEHNLKTALILHDEPDSDKHRESFKRGEIDILFVYNMLLTGFDAPRLKKLYLHRDIKAHNLLQTLTRVNRPYKNFHYGYVVDFANIDKTFEDTNKAYWNELQQELGEFSEQYNLLFKSPSEIKQELDSINEVLFGYDKDNKEIFTKQISKLKKEELKSLQQALINAKELYNYIMLSKQDNLKNSLDFATLKALLQIIEERLSLLRYEELISTEQIPTHTLESALENLAFIFKQSSKNELLFVDNDFIEKINHIGNEFSKNQDKKDKAYTTLFEELQALLKKKDIAPTQEHIKALQTESAKLLEQIQSLNAANDRLCAEYNGDSKFMRLHKRLLEKAESEHIEQLTNTALRKYLMPIKESLDDFVSNNTNILEQESYFIKESKSLTKSQREALFKLYSKDSSQSLFALITQEYLNQYKGDSA
ncbi:type I restriction endonuclease subunit R [Helicobacter sp. MIT 05-5293]|uniref:type I restriction endonuclease n=1 Tax=Helicobacter sp. MIT 05-5293 TaxID=1548149 RepID=UPI00068FEE05|nr:type I restriction endonuclease [Helicobacter sp. MIT 05-5293]TLD80901.1 type I restriction endonuclease subunit R [Helicobacter sp. MIT 05-5293]